MSNILKNRESERGAAGVKALCVLAAIALVGHAGYNYVPVAYSAESVKTDMNTAIMQGMALPGKVNVTIAPRVSTSAKPWPSRVRNAWSRSSGWPPAVAPRR